MVQASGSSFKKTNLSNRKSTDGETPISVRHEMLLGGNYHSADVVADHLDSLSVSNILISRNMCSC